MMVIIFLKSLKRKIMFCLRMLVVLAILAVLCGHIYSLIRSGGALDQPRSTSPGTSVYNPTFGPIDAGRGTFMDRLFDYLQEYYRGKHGR
ncbi:MULTISPECIES: hypothetical protein [Desulfofundulus]|jgi:hypothetical protein|uniref:Uncharacterized protein n=1 Tax=Desulfofundulus australicus DSM 11792 TaxID=1121425 RepID=A0A1M5AE68_9FIRM|nr:MULTISPECIES: hypothetical protein [Desulfofundulus]MBE3584660.1 hypothetical protein [Thermoanaerobacter sp.]MCS5694755.1 hypothetical protein [Desulfofundulus thermocisternus]MDK2887603.1 hypothetical protein [Thermoanaerobacter sp.]SHF28588.1 hypothetical protein SAMN02745218_01873 [Desulfofundulus australicus DSM 11792]